MRDPQTPNCGQVPGTRKEKSFKCKKDNCLTNGLQTIRLSLKFMIFRIFSTFVKEINVKFAFRFYIVLFKSFLFQVLMFLFLWLRDAVAADAYCSQFL